MSQRRRMAWIAIASVVAISISLLTVWQFTKNATADGHGHVAAKPSSSTRPVPQAENAKPLRPGEKRLTLQLPTSYTPAAPDGVGTDDYRCFLLDPKLVKPTDLTGYDVLPDNPDVVHHVILFKVAPGDVAAAKAVDESTPGEGWTCFGDAGVPGNRNLDDAPWLGAWAPGGTERVFGKNLSMPLAKGSQIIMQMHYNLLKGASADQSAIALRVRKPSPKSQALHMVLLPAPVEMPCRAGKDDGPLCDRAAAMADVRQRFGQAASIGDALHLLCGTSKPGVVQSCIRNINRPMTVRAVAGHMHLLGREITITLIPADGGTPRTLLHIGTWNFDEQEAQTIKPVQLKPFDKVKVTCRHAQWPRDGLPAFSQQREDRYVVWGEGSTDEMCLGLLSVTE